MVNINKLRGLISENNFSQKDIAKQLGISNKTMYSKMKSGKFTCIEMEKLIKILDIKEPSSIFFAM